MEKQVKMSFTERYEWLQQNIEKLARKVINLDKMIQQQQSFTRPQYYFLKNEIQQMTIDISTVIHGFSKQELKMIDTQIVIDSFDTQAKRLKRIYQREEEYKFRGTLIRSSYVSSYRRTTIKKQQDSDHSVSHQDISLNASNVMGNINEEDVCFENSKEQDFISICLDEQLYNNMTQQDILNHSRASVAILRLAQYHRSDSDEETQEGESNAQFAASVIFGSIGKIIGKFIGLELYFELKNRGKDDFSTQAIGEQFGEEFTKKIQTLIDLKSKQKE